MFSARDDSKPKWKVDGGSLIFAAGGEPSARLPTGELVEQLRSPRNTKYIKGSQQIVLDMTGCICVCKFAICDFAAGGKQSTSVPSRYDYHREKNQQKTTQGTTVGNMKESIEHICKPLHSEMQV